MNQKNFLFKKIIMTETKISTDKLHNTQQYSQMIRTKCIGTFGIVAIVLF